MNYYFGGINGVGKSRIIDEIADTNPKFRAVHTSRELMAWMGISNDYEAQRKMDQDEVLKKYAQFTEEMLASEKNRSLLFDSHFLNLIRGNTIDRTGNWIEKFDAIVLIEADPTWVYERIASEEKYRDRALFPDNASENEKFKILEEYSLVTRKKFEELVKRFKLPNIKLLNGEGRLETVVEEFLAFDEKLSVV